MYLKINGEDKNYKVNISYFITQHGKNGVRFFGEEIPETNKGFKYYDDLGNVFADLSDYKYLYKSNQYSTEKDEIEEGSCSFNPIPSDPTINNINKRINNLNNKVNEITPYTEEKIGYYGDKYKTFYDVPEGNVSVFFDNYDGNYSVKRLENGLEGLVVSFPEALKQQTTITIMVQ